MNFLKMFYKHDENILHKFYFLTHVSMTLYDLNLTVTKRKLRLKSFMYKPLENYYNYLVVFTPRPAKRR